MTEKRHQTKIYSYIYNEQYTFTNTFLFKSGKTRRAA